MKLIFAIIATVSLAFPAMLQQAWGDPGDLIVTRTVSPRTAFRPGTGPVSAKVNPGEEVQSALGLNQYPGGTVAHELSNSDFANVFTGQPTRNGILVGHGAGMVGAFSSNTASRGGTIGRTITGVVGGGAGGGGGIGGVGGMVRQATDGLMGALTSAGLMGR